MRRILVAIDLQEDSVTALQWVIENVVRDGDEIHVVHIAKLKVTCFSLQNYLALVCSYFYLYFS